MRVISFIKKAPVKPVVGGGQASSGSLTEMAGCGSSFSWPVGQDRAGIVFINSKIFLSINPGPPFLVIVVA